MTYMRELQLKVKKSMQMTRLLLMIETKATQVLQTVNKLFVMKNKKIMSTSTNLSTDVVFRVNNNILLVQKCNIWAVTTMRVGKSVN